MTSAPKETCHMKPFEICVNQTVNVPTLEPVTECDETPKEVCVLQKVNPRKVARPVVQLWCNDTGPGPGPKPELVPKPGVYTVALSAEQF